MCVTVVQKTATGSSTRPGLICVKTKVHVKLFSVYIMFILCLCVNQHLTIDKVNRFPIPRSIFIYFYSYLSYTVNKDFHNASSKHLRILTGMCEMWNDIVAGGR